MVTLRELPVEELFGPGHRLCAGCGPAISMRMLTKAFRGPTVITNATGCVEVASSIYPFNAWGVPWVHTAFENAAATASGIEAGFKALRRKGKLEKNIDVIAIGGDGGTFDIGIQALSGALERGHDFVYLCYDNEAYMNCLPGDTLVMTESGVKRIDEIQLGERLYTFDKDSNTLSVSRCSGLFDNGVRPVYEIATLHHFIRSTPNHPYLVVERHVRGRSRELRWRMLSELKVGDEIVVLKRLAQGETFKFNFSPVTGNHYKVHRLNEVKIPSRSSPELLEYLGLYVGDGWVRPRKGEVGFAVPEGSTRKRLLELHMRLFGEDTLGRSDEYYVYFNSVNLARFIHSLGFGRGAKNKTIPSWVFTLTEDEKEAFIEGLLLSDDYRYGKSYRYVSSSRDLLKRLRLLLQTMNYRVGKISWQTAKKGKKFPHRTLLKDTGYGFLCFSRKRYWNLEKYWSQYRYQDPLIETDNFTVEAVRHVEYVGNLRTYDLRVEKDHNFIAEGVVVHNTGIQRSGATPHGAATTTSPAGSKIPGKPEWKKDLIGICIAHGIDYAATASIAYWNDYITKVRKAIEVDGPAVVHVIAPCPLGWRSNPRDTVKIAKLAVQTRFFPVYEYEEGTYRLSIKVPTPKPVEEFLKLQGRFRHLFQPEFRDEINKIQDYVNRNYERIAKLCGEP